LLIQCDASQLEWRVALELSQDQVGINEVLNKEDTHSKNQVAFKLPSRLISKIYLFRTIFRGSGWSFANDPNFMHVSSSPSYWDAINEKFYEKYYGLDAKHKEWANLVALGSPIISPLGREWSINMGVDKRGQLYLPWTIFTNYPVQGTGADIMTIARISFFKKLKNLGLEKTVLLVSSVHDSIVVDAPSHLLSLIADLFHQTFSDLVPNIKRIFGYDWVVPLACEVKYGPNMKDMVKMT
jgi:hypothetical protein